MQFKIKNWEKFQHFKDRTPPWIKLYRNLLDDPDWHELDPAASKILVMLWLVASESHQSDGVLPHTKKLAFRLRISEKNLCNVLSQLSNWLIQLDNSTITDCYQTDAPERAREETETETETDIRASAKQESQLEHFETFWVSYPRKKNKGDAEKAWRVVRPDAALLSRILGAVEVAKRGDDWRKESGKYIPYPASWLRAKGWEDGQTLPLLEPQPDPAEIITLPDGRQMTRAQRDFVLRMSA